ncbi:MAG: hypothetical protein V3V20_02955 [Algisphaera sp.]
MSPRIQEPDVRFLTPLRMVLVLLLVPALVWVAMQLFSPTQPTSQEGVAPLSQPQQRQAQGKTP